MPGRRPALRWSCAATRWPPPTGGSSRRSPPRPPSRCARSGSPSEAAAAGPLAEADRLRTALLVGGQPRPAHPARLGQGRGGQPAQPRRRVRRRRPRRAARHRRGVAGPAGPAGGEPARHEPAAGRRARHVAATRSASEDAVPAALDDLGRRRPRRRRPTSRTTCRRCTPTRACSSGSWSTCSPTPCATARPASRPRSPPASTPARSSSGSSTTARASRRTDWDHVFLPFQRLGDRDNAHRRRARPRPVPRAGRGDGRHPHPGDHPRRRPHHDVACRPDRADRPPTALPRELARRNDPHPRRRRRTADPARPADQPAAPASTTSTSPPTAPPRCSAAASHPPDLVVLDLGLPDIDGVEVIRGLRGWTPVPIIVLSGRADSGDKVAALDAGADDYVTKPFGIGRAARPDPRGHPPARPDQRRPCPRCAIGRHTVDLADRTVTARRRHRGHADPHRVGAARDAAAQPRQADQPTAAPAARSGGRTTSTRPTTCASTWPSCGASSRTTRPAPGT